MIEKFLNKIELKKMLNESNVEKNLPLHLALQFNTTEISTYFTKVYEQHFEKSEINLFLESKICVKLMEKNNKDEKILNEKCEDKNLETSTNEDFSNIFEKSQVKKRKSFDTQSLFSNNSTKKVKKFDETTLTKTTDEQKLKIFGDVPFPNRFYAHFQTNEVNFIQMCSFNSLFHAFYALFNYNENFKKHVHELKSEFEIFNFILEVKEKFNDFSSVTKRNQKWIDLIEKHFPNRINSKCQNDGNEIICNMEWDVTNVVEDIDGGFVKGWENTTGKKYFCVRNNANNCTEKDCDGISKIVEHFMTHIVISKENLMIKTALESNLLSQLKTILNCTICDKVTDNNPHKHFKTFYQIKNSEFLEMDDLSYHSSIIQKHPLSKCISPILVNPVILIYVKSDQIDEEMFQADEITEKPNI